MYMKLDEPRVRLLYSSLITQKEISSAIHALSRFKRFGVQFDYAELGKDDRKASKGVKNGKLFRELVLSETPRICLFDLGARVSDVLLNRCIIPIGLTNRLLVEVSEFEGSGHTQEPKSAVSKCKDGAIISLFQIRHSDESEMMNPGNPYRNSIDPEWVSKSIEIMVLHEMGHVFGIGWHCPKNDCIMQKKNEDADVIRSFIRNGLDFCRDCSSSISSQISRMIAPV